MFYINRYRLVLFQKRMLLFLTFLSFNILKTILKYQILQSNFDIFSNLNQRIFFRRSFATNIQNRLKKIQITQTLTNAKRKEITQNLSLNLNLNLTNKNKI